MRSAVLTLGLALAACATGAGNGPRSGHHVARAEAPVHGIAGGMGRATLLLNEDTGAREAAVTHLVLEAGAEVPEHVHEGSAEILYIEQGVAETIIEGRRVVAHPGDAVYIPAGARHSARVPADGEDLHAVQVYVGPGPEQRFRKGPKLEADAR